MDKRLLPFLGLFLFLYISLPTSSSTMDAFGYAADARWGYDLFSPHHLLYTAFLWLIGNMVQWVLPFEVDFLAIGKLMNGVFAVASLYVLHKCLKQIDSESYYPYGLTFLVGSCFAVMRFATENETYIIPVFFSLLGTLYFLKWTKNTSITLIFWSGFWLSIACLFHQIHFFWWVGLVVSIFIKNRKSFVAYVFPAILVPVGYVWAAIGYYSLPFSIDGIMGFVFSNFHSGSAYLSLNGTGVARFVFSLVRTFFQIHGTTWLVVTKGEYAWFFAALMVCFIAYSFIMVVYLKEWKKIKKPTFDYLSLTFVGIMVLHLAFALVSMGNSEFMVMVPFLLALIICTSKIVAPDFFQWIITPMILWNFIFGLAASNKIKFTGFDYWSKKAVENQMAFFFMRQYGEVGNQVYYETGKTKHNVYFSDVKDSTFRNKVDSLLLNQVDVYTDCATKAPFLNTEAFLMQTKQEEFYAKYTLVKVDSVMVYGGWEYLFHLKK